jgi:16S rRNA (uracil1498-N3)-methyltransferase
MFNRYFIDTLFSPRETVLLTGREFHHLRHVMRMKSGESVELINGHNVLAIARIETIDEESASLFIQKVEKKTFNKRRVLLVQAIPRLNHLEWIVEKGTELNVEAFWLFPSLLSEKIDFSSSQQQRLIQISIAAMKQCGRTDLPPIHYLSPLEHWKNIPEGMLLFGDTRPSAPFLNTCAVTQEPIYLFIGPEKGFHPKEEKILSEKFNALGVRLHENILRVETASLAAVACLMSI